MKQLFLFVFLLSTFTAFAQFEKGTRTIGINLAGIGFTNYQQSFDLGSIGTSTNTNNSFNISLQPSMGKFVSNNLLIGGGPTVNLTTVKYTSSGIDYSGNTFTGGVNVFGRYYFTGEGFLPYVQLNTGAAFGGGSQDGNLKGTLASGQTYTGKYEEKFKSIFNFNVGVGAGLTKMLNKNVGLDIGLAYQLNLRKYNYSALTNYNYSNPAGSERVESSYKFTGTTNNVSLSLGVLVFLDPKK
jgi:hypothetical protein